MSGTQKHRQRNKHRNTMAKKKNCTQTYTHTHKSKTTQKKINKKNAIKIIIIIKLSNALNSLAVARITNKERGGGETPDYKPAVRNRRVR